MRHNVSDMAELERRIDQLESVKQRQQEEIKATYRDVANRLSPANLIRQGLQNIVETPGLKATAVDTAVSEGAGYLGKKLFVLRSRNIFRKLGGLLIQLIVTNIVRNKIPAFRAKTDTKKTLPAPQH